MWSAALSQKRLASYWYIISRCACLPRVQITYKKFPNFKSTLGKLSSFHFTNPDFPLLFETFRPLRASFHTESHTEASVQIPSAFSAARVSIFQFLVTRRRSILLVSSRRANKLSASCRWKYREHKQSKSFLHKISLVLLMPSMSSA